MKNKKIMIFILVPIIILGLYFSTKYSILLNHTLLEKILRGGANEDGIILDDKIYAEYNEFIDAGTKIFTIDGFRFFKFFYDADDDSFFFENKAYKKVSKEKIDEIYYYFEVIYNDYYDTRIFPEDFDLKEVISENDYYYIYDEFFDNKKLYKPYEEFEFYYYDAEEHVLYMFSS